MQRYQLYLDGAFAIIVITIGALSLQERLNSSLKQQKRIQLKSYESVPGKVLTNWKIISSYMDVFIVYFLIAAGILTKSTTSF